MDIKITDNLKTFRKENGNTQEELANHLNISVQAVSKWERGEGYPDISLLPSIAVFYNKTVDDLLGCGEIDKSKKINEYIRQYRENGTLGKIQDNIDLMKAALKEFPNNLTLMSNLCESLLFVNKIEDVAKIENVEECIKVGEKILQSCIDDKMRFSTIQNLVYAYNRKEDITKAREYAEKLPNLYCSQNAVLEQVEKGEELRNLTQMNIFQYITSIHSSVYWMLHSKDYTPEEKIDAYKTVDKLFNLFYHDGDYEMMHFTLTGLWIKIAFEYAKLQNISMTISALKKSYYHAYKADNLKPGEYSSIFTDALKSTKNIVMKNTEKSSVEWLESTMQESIFDFIRGTDEWNCIMEPIQMTKLNVNQ